MCSIETATATQTRDMSVDAKDAWVWGIVLGWEAKSIRQMIRDGNVRWDDAAIARLRRLRTKWTRLHRDTCAAYRFRNSQRSTSGVEA